MYMYLYVCILIYTYLHSTTIWKRNSTEIENVHSLHDLVFQAFVREPN